MTDRTETPTSASLGHVFALCGVVLAIFAINQFGFGPLFGISNDSRAAQTIFVMIRVVGLVGLAFGLAKHAKCNRFQTLSTVLVVGFVDQVIFKSVWVKADIRLHPAAWVGFEPSNVSIFLNMALGYLFFTPLVLILAFFGMESTRFRRDWKVQD